MDRELLLRLAREAGLFIPGAEVSNYLPRAEDFAALVAAEIDRDWCAAIVETQADCNGRLICDAEELLVNYNKRKKFHV